MRGIDVNKRYVPVPGDQGPHKLLGLRGGEQPVRTVGDHQKAGGGLGKSLLEGAVGPCDIEIVHGLGDIDIDVGIEAFGEAGSLVIEVGLHRKLVLNVVAQAVR